MMSREELRLPLLDGNSNGGCNGGTTTIGGGGGGGGTNSGAGAPTLTTPTLTPTTLRNIEQMFMDSDPSAQCEPPEQHENAAGFVPPSVSMVMVNQDPEPQQQPLIPYVQAKPPSNNPTAAATAAATLDWVLAAPHPPPPLVSTESSSQQVKIESTSTTTTTTTTTNMIDPEAAALPGPPPQPQPLPPPPALPSVPLPVTSNAMLLPLLSNLTPVTSAAAAAASASINLPTVPCIINNDDNHNKVIVNNNNNNNVVTKRRSSGGGSGGGGGGGGGGGRKVNSNDSHLTPEERIKRELRRERNKEAAARCRKRRLDQTLTLQEEVDELDSKKAQLTEEFRRLQSQREELEQLLKSHRLICTKSIPPPTSDSKAASSNNIKAEPVDH